MKELDFRYLGGSSSSSKHLSTANSIAFFSVLLLVAALVDLPLPAGFVVAEPGDKEPF